MRIEVLYVAGCPFHPAAVDLVRSILAAEGLDSRVHEILVCDEKMAEVLRFRGSPTIRVDGRDVAGETSEEKGFALSCRLYAGSPHVGLPPSDLVLRAVLEARKGSERP